jgi:hypothetical protein
MEVMAVPFLFSLAFQEGRDGRRAPEIERVQGP